MEKGYAVFEPDSFARPGREPCGENVMDKRLEELGYAREMIRDLSWVDQERVYLMGISEGGAAVAAWGQPGFAAHIITLANCNGGRPKAPEGVPVLAIIGEKDDYYAGTSCNVIRKINGSRSMVIPDGLHAILDAPEVEQAIEEFLELQESS
jgi:dienelactone hydrolase